jgi:hypothetical protein
LHLLRFIPVVGIRCAPPHNPFNPQPLISYLTNSNECGNLTPGSANVSPLRTLLLPQPSVYSQPPAFLGQSRRVSQAVSYSCGLFSLLALFFARASFVFNSLQTLFAKCRGWVGLSHPGRLYGARGVAYLRDVSVPVAPRCLGSVLLHSRVDPCALYLSLESTLAKVYQNKQL